MKSAVQGVASGKTRREKNKQEEKAIFSRTTTKTVVSRVIRGLSWWIKCDWMSLNAAYTDLKLDLKTN